MMDRRGVRLAQRSSGLYSSRGRATKTQSFHDHTVRDLV